MDKWLVSAEKCGKVVALYFSKRLKEFATIRAMHKDCDVVAMNLDVKSSIEEEKEEKKENQKCVTRQVRCIETGEIFVSVTDCANAIKVQRWTVYKAIQHGFILCKRHYEYVK